MRRRAHSHAHSRRKVRFKWAGANMPSCTQVYIQIQKHQAPIYKCQNMPSCTQVYIYIQKYQAAALLLFRNVKMGRLMCAAGSSEKVFSNTAKYVKYVKCAKYIKYFQILQRSNARYIDQYCHTLLLSAAAWHQVCKKVDFEQN